LQLPRQRDVWKANDEKMYEPLGILCKDVQVLAKRLFLFSQQDGRVQLLRYAELARRLSRVLVSEGKRSRKRERVVSMTGFAA
jgi:hypothetical protein